METLAVFPVVVEFIGVILPCIFELELLYELLLVGLVNDTPTTDGEATVVASIYLAVIFGITNCPFEIETYVYVPATSPYTVTISPALNVVCVL